MPRKRAVEIPIIAKNLAKKGLKAVGADVDALGKKVKQFNLIGKKIKAIGESIGRVGRKVTIAAGIMTAAIAVPSKAFATFETGIARVSSLIGGDVRQTYEQFADQVMALGSAAGTSTKELNEGLFDIISAGVPAAEAMKFLEVATKGAVGGFTDVKTAAGGMLAIMNSYKKSADDALGIAELFAIANEKGVTTFGALGDTIGRVASTASNFGVSAEELLGGVAAITATSKKSTDEAVTGIRALIIAITNAQDSQIAWLDEMQKGVPVADRLELSIEGLQKTGLQEWLNRAIKLTGGYAPAMDKLIGSNVRAKGAVFDLVAGQEKFNETVDLMVKDGPNGVRTLRNYEGRMGTLEMQFKQGRQEVMNMFIALGRELKPALLDVFNFIKPIIRATTDWIKANRGLVSGIGKIVVIGTAVAAVVGPLLIAVGGMVSAAGVVTTIIPLLPVIGKAIFLIVGTVSALMVVWDLIKLIGSGLKAIGDFFFSPKAVPLYAQVKGMDEKDLAGMGFEANSEASIVPAAAKAESKITDIHNKEEKKRTKGTLDAIKKRLAAFKNAGSGSGTGAAGIIELGKEQFDKIRDQFWLDSGSLNSLLAASGGQGFAKTAIVKSVTSGKKAQEKEGGMINVENLYLPDVFSGQDFANNLFDFSRGNNYGFQAEGGDATALSGLPVRNTGGSGGSW